MRFKAIGIAIAMICSLCFIGFVVKSEAASITYLSVDSNTDYGQGGDCYASLAADEDIQFIDWYVKQTYPTSEADSEYEILFTSSHYGGTSVYVWLGSFDGHIKIAEYDIKAVALFTDAENNTFVSDSSTTTTSVYKPVYEGGYKITGIYGYSELTAHYFDGSSIVMDGYAWAYNGTGGNATGTGRFRHTATNRWMSQNSNCQSKPLNKVKLTAIAPVIFSLTSIFPPENFGMVTFGCVMRIFGSKYIKEIQTTGWRKIRMRLMKTTIDKPILTAGDTRPCHSF